MNNIFATESGLRFTTESLICQILPNPQCPVSQPQISSVSLVSLFSGLKKKR
jgi:hypothetical protein